MCGDGERCAISSVPLPLPSFRDGVEDKEQQTVAEDGVDDRRRQHFKRSDKLNKMKSGKRREMSWSEVSLVHVCDRLKPVVYAKHAGIVRKGEPIDEMSIVLQGKLCTFSFKDTGSTNNVSCDTRKDLLKEGDFCREELFNWVQDEPSSSKKLISNRTIKALTKVEALVLRTNDLKDIYNQKAKVIQAFLGKKRIVISGRNGQTPPGELTAPEIVVQRQ
ncbi:hypothetical protein LWI29_032439 [Acer saccharum]|uniref:Cyclic nucleotide-binding domain-containing protein n=1 Tax=Acer saccharum TaxID=4024 RepID=A0AA39SPN5_ACESA|nr:hypothetical protein LWI29_032439 [Acer saccharum]